MLERHCFLQDVNIVEALAEGLASLAVMGSPPHS